MEKGHILYYPDGLHNIDLKSVELEEQTTEDNTVLKYKSSDGSDRYVLTSDSPEGGSGGEGTLTVVIRQIDNVTLTVDKNASEVVDALIAGKSVFYIYKSANETRATSFILVDSGLYPDSRTRIGVVFLDTFIDNKLFWKQYTHQGDTITLG